MKSGRRIWVLTAVALDQAAGASSSAGYITIPLVMVFEDEEVALEAFVETLESYGADDNELEELASMPLGKKGKKIEWSDGESAVELLETDTVR